MCLTLNLNYYQFGNNFVLLISSLTLMKNYFGINTMLYIISTIILLYIVV